MLKEYDANGAFRFTAGLIESLFTDISRMKKNRQRMNPIKTKIERAFLDSDIIHGFCDCSNNFEQERLTKEFNKRVYEVN